MFNISSLNQSGMGIYYRFKWCDRILRFVTRGTISIFLTQIKI